MRVVRIIVVICLGLLAWLVPVPARAALPHGCYSQTSDFSASTDPSYRRFAVKVYTDEPCTFVYAEGDTFSGSGRFTVSCSTGGYYHHPDFQDGQYPPVANVPIPQPCDVGATVTLQGYHAFTGGAVVGGGPGSAPSLPAPRPAQPDLSTLCAPGSDPHATVELLAPVDYSGLLTYRGEVRCDAATVRITSLRITPAGGEANPSAGTAQCVNCTEEIEVVGTVPALGWVYDVEMQFDITAVGKPTATGTRVGRYAVHWGGNVTTLCPGQSAGPLPPDDRYIDVPTGETCPV